jgi:hypothetical protein
MAQSAERLVNQADRMESHLNSESIREQGEFARHGGQAEHRI